MNRRAVVYLARRGQLAGALAGLAQSTVAAHDAVSNCHPGTAACAPGGGGLDALRLPQHLDARAQCRQTRHGIIPVVATIQHIAMTAPLTSEQKRINKLERELADCQKLLGIALFVHPIGAAEGGWYDCVGVFGTEAEAVDHALSLEQKRGDCYHLVDLSVGGMIETGFLKDLKPRAPIRT